MRNRRSLWWRLGFMLLAMAIFVLSYQWGNEQQRRHPRAPQISGVLLRPPVQIAALDLHDAFGRPFDLTQGWTLLAFGALSDASGQLAVQRLVEVLNRLADRPALREQLHLVLLDPAANLAQARDFMRLSPALRILDAKPEMLDALRATLGQQPSSPDDSFYLLGPGGFLLALLPRQSEGAILTADLAAIYDAAWLLLPEPKTVP